MQDQQDGLGAELAGMLQQPPAANGGGGGDEGGIDDLFGAAPDELYDPDEM